MIKIAHFADLHASQKNKEEAIKALKFILETCEEREVDAIVNAGDTWDGAITLNDSGPFNEIIGLIGNTAPAPMYIIQGTPSHDIPGSINIFRRLSQPHLGDTHRTLIFREAYGPMRMITKKGELGTISLLPAPSKSILAKGLEASPDEINELIRSNLRAILADFGAKVSVDDKPHILVAHITVTGSETSTGQTMYGGDIQVSTADLTLANADYIALGHIHKSQQDSFPDHISYAGSPYHQNFGELEPKGFKIVTFNDSGKLQEIEFIETPSRPRQVIDAHIVDGKLEYSEEPCKGADIKVRIHAEAHQFNPEMEKDAHTWCETGNSTIIEKITSPLMRIRAANLTEAKTLRDKLTEYAEVKEAEVTDTSLEKADILEEEVRV